MTGWSKHPAPPSVETQLSSKDVTDDQRQGVSDLIERAYGHVLRVIDLDRLYQIEQALWSELDRLGIYDDESDLATALLAELLHRVGHAPDRHAALIPPGITDDEVMAAEYDHDCLMCRNEAEDMRYRLSGRRCQDLARDAEDEDMRGFMERAANAWRTKHVDALRRFGLA